MTTPVGEQDWEAAGCARSCLRQHTYRWGACAYGREPAPALASFQLATSDDGERTGYYETLGVEQVAAWLREQGYSVVKRLEGEPE